MEVEGSGPETGNKNESDQQQQQPNTSSNSATGNGGQQTGNSSQTGNVCPEVEMVSDVDCSISENDWNVT